ncbi:metallophosphoesterase [Candidatus Woesearchaeota archaeon]|nr:metallophosphoesterase [Candidatus Woesearchaeota archaeon]
MTQKKPKEFIEEMFEKGILINEEILSKRSHSLDDNIIQKIELEEDLLVLNEDYAHLLTQSSLVDWYEIDKSRVDAEKDRDDDLYQAQLKEFSVSQCTIQSSVSKQNIVSSSTLIDQTLSVQPDKNITFQSENIFLPESDELSFPEIGSDDQQNTTLQSTTLQNNLYPTTVTIVVSYQNNPRKYYIEDFTNFFLSRYRFLESILRNRKELNGILPIKRILQKTEKEKVSLIGIVKEIGETKNGNIIITLEDPSGEIKILVSKNKNELYLTAKDLVVDEVVGMVGVFYDKIIFVDSFVWPDIPQSHELKKGPEEEYVIFLSDIHVGSKLFLKKEFHKLLQWLQGKMGNEEQQQIAQKVKYIFIAGDLVDGVGIYPSQQEELEIDDISLQYAAFTELIKQIPSDKKIIICPGNHDVVHLAEPQPVFYQEFAPGLFDLPQVTLVTNPALVNIGKTVDFAGFDVLMYHGFSFDYYVANVESIRSQGGYHRSDLIMKFLLKRRHLAPSFKSTPYYPSHAEDPLLIKTIPDFFITGHIHYSKQANYRGVTMISGSCWQGKTTFQEKLGHQPEPARVPIVNLKTRQIKVLRFG